MINRHLQIDSIKEELSSVVYNPQESTVLFLHKAKSENLATDIASAFNYFKLFILLFHNVLKNSHMKVIPSVVTYENVNAENTVTLRYYFLLKPRNSLRWPVYLMMHYSKVVGTKHDECITLMSVYSWSCE